jgi:pimeloyl-ACP methyl ester carboxylesterase
LRTGPFLTVLLALSGCRTPSGTDPVAVIPGTVRAADGLPIAYDLRGGGKTTLLFVHCWAGDRSFWRGELDEFARDYRVVAIDLPGHGESGKERKEWSIAGLGEDVKRVVGALDLRRVILVGHSLGGPVSLEAAARLPGRILGVVGVDTLQNADVRLSDEGMRTLAARFEADFDGTMAEMLGSMFAEESAPGVKDWVIAKARAANRPAVLAIFRKFPSFDAKEALSAAKVPVRCVNAVAHPPRGMATAVETNRKYADYDAVLMDGVGHYPMLERPSEFNARLREVVAALAAR